MLFWKNRPHSQRPLKIRTMASGWRTFISWLEPIWLLGIDKVYGGAFCTVTEHERFYSYRRDNQTGRMATLIWKK
jgi:hypothetical protein